MQQLKGAFPGCSWCHGSGCMACDEERRKFEASRRQPIFTARYDSPEDMEAMKRVFGREALERAFGPGGGGMREVEENAALESLKQCLRGMDAGE